MDRSRLEALLIDCRCDALEAGIDEAERVVRARRVYLVTAEIARIDQQKVVDARVRR